MPRHFCSPVIEFNRVLLTNDALEPTHWRLAKERVLVHAVFKTARAPPTCVRNLRWGAASMEGFCKDTESLQGSGMSLATHGMHNKACV
jgi:hypothetical protein